MATLSLPRQAAWVGSLEFKLLQAAVLLAPYSSFRHPSLFFTVSDALFAFALMLRLSRGVPSSPFGAGTWVWLAGLGALTGGLFISSLANGDPVRCIIVIAQYVFAYLCVPFTLLARPREDAVRLIKWGVLSMFLMCAIGIVYYMLGHNSGYAKQFNIVTGGGRLASLVDNPNGLAGLIALALPLLGFLAFERHVRALAAFVCLATLVTALVLTSSNTGLFAAAVAVLVFFGGKRDFKSLLAAALAALLLFTWGEHLLPRVFHERVLNAVTSGDISEAGTYAHRSELMHEALGMVGAHLWVGLGADQYRVVSELKLPVHNTYLLLINEGGALSLLGWLTLLAGAAIAVLEKRSRRQEGLVLVTTISVILVTAGLSMTYSHMYARFLILPLLLALSPAVATPSGRGPGNRPAPGPASWRPAIVAARARIGVARNRTALWTSQPS